MAWSWDALKFLPNTLAKWSFLNWISCKVSGHRQNIDKLFNRCNTHGLHSSYLYTHHPHLKFHKHRIQCSHSYQHPIRDPTRERSHQRFHHWSHQREIPSQLPPELPVTFYLKCLNFLSPDPPKNFQDLPTNQFERLLTPCSLRVVIYHFSDINLSC